MREIYRPELDAYLSLDDDGAVRAISHVQAHRAATRPSPRAAAVDYVRELASVLQIPAEQLSSAHQRVSYLTPTERGTEYRFEEEKAFFDSTTVTFWQTHLDVPVWGAGMTVTVKHDPTRVVEAVNTSLADVTAALPPEADIARWRRLADLARREQVERQTAEDGGVGAEQEEPSATADAVLGLLAPAKGDAEAEVARATGARIIRTRFFVYRYDPDARLPQPEQRPTEPTAPTLAAAPTGTARTTVEEEPPPPVLPLPPVNRRIRPGRDYLVAEVTFSLTTPATGPLNWLALVEVTTNSVLYLRALVAAVNGLVFLQDPISSTGVATNTPDQPNAVLNPLRVDVTLPNLDAPVMGNQALRGSFARVINVEDPNIGPPSQGTGVDFDYDVRTNDFAAVSSYYHTDRFFQLVADLGFPIATYFDATTFPVPVDHRDMGTTINAHCVGNGLGGIHHVGYALNDLTNTTNPIGRACDWRVHLHELGGHGVLYEHVNSANLGFAHSAGDSLSLIVNDPTSQAPDRFRYAPWHPTLGRRCDRDVAAGWAWGGANDTGGYASEEILATTLFRVYRSIGGDSTSLSRRRFASRMMSYLILRAISTLTPATNPTNALGFANALIAVDQLNWTSEGVFGGAYSKVIRWAFERQGLYQPPGAPTPVTAPGAPPAVDVYIDDGRTGQYPFQAVHWNTTTIWNRTAPDGIDAHQPPVLGASNYAYVKVRNRGTQTATGVVVKGFHCKPSAGLLWPDDLQPMTTPQLSVGSIAPNDSEEVTVGPFEWTPVINAYGHDCLLMVASASGDAANIDNFTPGETIPEWRLVPNDNNIGQRNVNPVPGGGGTAGLMAGLDRYSFWVGNPGNATATMEVQVKLPAVLARHGWRLQLDHATFELAPRTQREVVLQLEPGDELQRAEVEAAGDRDVVLTVLADGAVLGGMTYRLDPELSRPVNEPQGRPTTPGACVDAAAKLIDCLDVPGRRVTDVRVAKVTVDIHLADC